VSACTRKHATDFPFVSLAITSTHSRTYLTPPSFVSCETFDDEKQIRPGLSNDLYKASRESPDKAFELATSDIERNFQLRTLWVVTLCFAAAKYSFA
jgi:hypothetical protein